MADPVWTIILAAGASSRFGGPKALAAWNGGTLLSHAAATARAACGDRVLVVTGGHRDEIKARAAGLRLVYNEGWRDGMAGSIAAGFGAVLAAEPQAHAVLILPVDQPLADADHLKALAATAWARNVAVLSEDCGISGPPACVPRKLFPLVLAARGDGGLKNILPDFLTIAKSGVLADVDTKDALEKIRTGR